MVKFEPVAFLEPQRESQSQLTRLEPRLEGNEQKLNEEEEAAQTLASSMSKEQAAISSPEFPKNATSTPTSISSTTELGYWRSGYNPSPDASLGTSFCNSPTHHTSLDPNSLGHDWAHNSWMAAIYKNSAYDITEMTLDCDGTYLEPGIHNL